MDYRREIDGLRTVAVLPVIFFHAGIQGFSGGFVGVDIFFVISGYLITSIIVAEKDAGTFSLVNFYERRARRILPALFVVMAACIPFAWLWLLPLDFKKFAGSLAAVVLFISNHFFSNQAGYFDTAAELKPLLHTWSLAVEEQYYLLFPTFLIAIWGLGKKWIYSLTLSIALLSLTLAQWASTAAPTSAFFILPTRCWELLIGALCAFYLFQNNHKRSQTTSEIASLLGISLILYSIFQFSERLPFPSVYTLAPTIGAGLIILFTTPTTTVGRLLGSRIFVGIGLLSYSAYLWHQPIFAFARHRSLHEPSSTLMALLSLATIGLAYFSWRFIERPFRNKEKFNQKNIFIYSIMGCVAFIFIGLAIKNNNGFPTRLPIIEVSEKLEMARIDNGFCFYSIDTIPSLAIGENGQKCTLGSRNPIFKGLLHGDSYAGQYEPLFEKVAQKNHLQINSITTNFCFPTVNIGDFTGPYNSRAFEQCKNNREYVIKNMNKFDFILLGGSWGNIFNQRKLNGTLEFIELASKNSRVVMIMPSPKQFDTNVLDLYQKSLWMKQDFEISLTPTEKDISSIDAHTILRDFSKKFKNVIFLERESIFSINKKPSDITTDGVPYSLEGRHISIYGAYSIVDNFETSSEFLKFKYFLKNTPRKP